VEWVEIKGRTVELAVEVGMRELGIEDSSRVEIEVLQEPERGFLGMGGRDAVVRVRPKSGNRKKRQGSRDRKPESSSHNNAAGGSANRSKGGGRDDRQNGRNRSGGGERRQAEPRPRQQEGPPVEVNPGEQAPVVEQFLTGLLESFGLEGTVTVGIEEDVLIATVTGEQTEALVGPRGSVIEAIHELTKTVLQRKFKEAARVRLDIAGYAERRRQALSIYAGRLIDQVVSEGGEIMLEPMSASDRKVVHDAVAEREGVRSYSEGEAPRRYVVIATVEEEAVEEEAAEGAGADEPAAAIEPEMDDEPDIDGEADLAESAPA
jgi:spoIIIJ-associated protein